MNGIFTESYLLAFVITPALVVALGYFAVRLQERANRRNRENHPAE